MEHKDFFFKQLEEYGGSTALVTAQEEIVTYGELTKRADLLAREIGRRCLIFLACRNAAESVIGYAACLRNNIVPVMVSADIDAGLLENLMDRYHPAYLWAPAENGVFSGEAVYRDQGYVLKKTGLSEDYVLGEDLALLLTTSGSTGSPKLVRQTWKNIQSNTDAIIEYLGIVPEDRAITTLPMNYTYGLSILNTHLSMGARMILTDATLLEKSFWTLFRNQGATTFGGVPYTYEILKKLRFGRMQLPSLRYITQAGGKLSKELAEEFNTICGEKGIRLIVMYGQTEATARMSWLPWKDAARKAGSIGIAIPGGRFALIDADGAEIQKAGEVGELVYRGGNVTPGYAESRMDLAKPDENQGELHTGDMAKRDEDGFYYVVGRKKRFLKLFGNRVNLDEVEGLLKKEGIENVCAGRDDRMVVFLTDPEKEGVAAEFLTQHTGISRGGFVIRRIDEIPRNDSGKVLYSALEIE